MDVNSSFYPVSYESDAQRSYMVAKLETEDRLIDYQIKMIKDNPMQNLLALYRKQFNNEIFIYYDITSKITLEQLLSRRKLSRHEFLTMVKSIVKGLQAGKRYLLYGGQYILDIRHMYVNPLTLEVSLAYMPVERQTNIKEELRAFLIDLIVYKAAFLNGDEGNFIYRLLNLLKSGAFSLAQLDKLISSIAMEYSEKGDNAEDKFLKNEASVMEIYRTPANKDGKSEEIKQSIKSSNPQNKLYLGILLQILFAALGMLVLRLLTKQNQGLDIYSAAGAILLIGSADFLVSKRLKVFFKSEKTKLNNEKISMIPKAPLIPAIKNNRNRNSYSNIRDFKDESKLYDFIEAETNIISEGQYHCACLAGVIDGKYERIALDKESFVIGRIKSQVDYISRNSAVGKVHAEIINKNGQYFIKDLNSRNGTYINGERIDSNVEYVIKNNDRVALANSEYQFLWTGGAS